MLCRVFSLLVCVSIMLGFAAAAHGVDPVDAPKVDLQKPGVNINPLLGKPSLYVRLVIDSLYCEKESKWDHASSQDEPYVMVIGFATHREPSSWVAGKPEVFSDVDTGNNRRFKKQQRVIFEGEVSEGSCIGFQAVLWEKDASSDNAVMKLADSVAHSITDWISEGKDLKAVMGRLMTALWPMLISGGVYLVGGGEDDMVGDKQVILSYEDLMRAAENHRHVYHPMRFDGGDEGKYWLRYHVEFGQDATSEFSAKFTSWDDMVVGNVDRSLGDEIVIVSDDDGPKDNGRFYVYKGAGMLSRSFDAPYVPYDRIALGDTMGRGVAHILVATPSDGGLVRVYDYMGNPVNRMNIPFAKHDGFGVGDVNGDGKAEIVIGRSSDRKVYIYSSQDGRKLDEFGLNWSFRGTRYTAKDSKQDVMLVGDVFGDEKAEIVMVENKNSNKSLIRVYNGRGAEVKSVMYTAFTNHDAAALGDVYGDGKMELILASSEDEKDYSYTMSVTDLAAGKQVGKRSWPWYLKHCGFAAGSIMPSAKAQMVVANSKDGKVYIGR